MTATIAPARPTRSTGRSTGRVKVLRTAQVLIALFLIVGSGLPKLAGEATAVETFAKIGWGDWFRYVTGVVEIAGAAGLLIPRLRGLAALGLIGLMAGAVLTQIFVLVPAWSLLPAALAVVFAVTAWDERTQIKALARR